MNLPLAQTTMEDLYQDVKQMGSPLLRRHQFNTGNLVTIRNLGHGNFCVDLMQDDRGNNYAVKKMTITTEDGKRKQLKSDLRFMLNAGQDHHPNIIRFYGCHVFRYGAWIVMELMHTCFGKLLQHFENGIPEEVIGVACSSIVTALNHLKVRHNIIHRDVRPSNILVHEEGTVKVCDFGISRELVNSVASTQGAGNELYLAPERLGTLYHKYGIKSDVWSLGITLMELATGRNPYHGLNSFDAVTRIIHDAAPRLPEDLFTPPFHAFVTRCLDKQISSRPNYAMLMLMEFFLFQPQPGSATVSSWLRVHQMLD